IWFIWCIELQGVPAGSLAVPLDLHAPVRPAFGSMAVVGSTQLCETQLNPTKHAAPSAMNGPHTCAFRSAFGRHVRPSRPAQNRPSTTAGGQPEPLRNIGQNVSPSVPKLPMQVPWPACPRVIRMQTPGPEVLPWQKVIFPAGPAQSLLSLHGPPGGDDPPGSWKTRTHGSSRFHGSQRQLPLAASCSSSARQAARSVASTENPHSCSSILQNAGSRFVSPLFMQQASVSSQNLPMNASAD